MGGESLGKIKILDESVSNIIAAGEVVENPASMIKELLENSLDAESKSIRIEIKNGGRDVVISDDGIGMSQEDLLLSIERHATSKISKKDDLYFFSLGKEYIYLNSFFIQVKHEKEEHSKQFYNYFVLRVKKSQEEEKTSIDKIFKEKTTENSEVFIFSCYEKISESEKTPIYYNIFYRNGKIVSIIRLAKKEDIKNLVEYLILNNILSEKEKNYINLITEELNK